MKKNKFIILFLFLVIFSVAFSFSVSAESVSGATEVYPFNVNSIDIALYDSNGNAIDINADVSGSDAYVEEGRVRFRIERSDGVSFSASSRYLVDISMSVTDSFYYNPERCISASYRYSVSSFASIMQYEDINIAYRALNWGEKIVHDGKFTYKSKNVADVYYPYSAIDESFTKYFNRIMVKFDSSSSFLYLNLLKVDFSVLTETELSSLKITENADANTDRILNEWSTDATPPTSTTDSYNEVEGALIDSTRGSAESSMSEVSDSLLGSLQRFTSSFAAIGSLFNQMLLVSIPDLGVLVWISLAVGIIPLIVGLTVNGLRSNDRSVANAKRQAERENRRRRK